MNYIAAPAAAADDDNVFYDSGREERKIAHYSKFRTHKFSYATFQRPQLRLVEKILLFAHFLCKTSQWLMRQLAGEGGKTSMNMGM